MKKTQCPICRSDVMIDDDAYKGDVLDCSNCGHELEITSLTPPTLQATDSDVDENFEEEEE